MDNQQYLAKDEIDLRDYINVVIKRKKLILTVFLVSVITAAVASFLMPKTYEITSVIQLGNVDKLLIKNEEAKEIILSQNSLLSIIDDLNLKTRLEHLQKNIKISDISGTSLLKIKITYPGIDTALKINNAIVNPFITQGQNVYQERLACVNERLKELNEEIKNSEGNIARTQTLISSISNSSDIPQSDVSLRIILLQNTLPNYENNLNALRNQRNGLKFMLIDAKDFKIFDAPIKPKKPITPNKKQNVAIAGIVSLMLGVFLAFFMEYWEKSKRA